MLYRSMLLRTLVRGMRGGATARRQQRRVEVHRSHAHLVMAKLRASSAVYLRDSSLVAHAVQASGIGKECGKSACGEACRRLSQSQSSLVETAMMWSVLPGANVWT